MIEFHKKHDNVPQSWYEITKGKIENPLFILRFMRDCESMMVFGKRTIGPIISGGCLIELLNANNLDLKFTGNGIRFAKERFSDPLPVPYGSYINKQ
jgi:hypothetical protein